MKEGHRFRKPHTVNTLLNQLLCSTLTPATRSRNNTATSLGSPVITSYGNHSPSLWVTIVLASFFSCFSFVTQMDIPRHYSSVLPFKHSFRIFFFHLLIYRFLLWSFFSLTIFLLKTQSHLPCSPSGWFCCHILSSTCFSEFLKMPARSKTGSESGLIPLPRLHVVVCFFIRRHMSDCLCY